MATYLIGGRLVAGDGHDAGEITVRRLVPRKYDVEVALNDAGSIEADVTTPQIDPITKLEVDLTTELVSGRDFLGLVVDDVIVECGPIWTDPNTPPFLSTLRADGLLSYFDHRKVLPPLTFGQLPRDVTSKWTGLSLRTIIKRLVQQACSWPGAALPIDYEPDFVGDHEREYPGSDLTVVADAIRNISAVEGGPDFTLRPKWGADRRHVRWDLLTGDPELTQGGHDHLWDVSAPTPHAKLTHIDRDARELASHAYLTGTRLRNQLTNSSFEEGFGAWGEGSNTTNRIHVTGFAPLDGTHYVAWNAVNPGFSYLSYSSTIPVEPGDRVILSFYGRANAALAMHCMIRFLNADGGAIVDVRGASIAVTSSGWWRGFATATAPDGAAGLTVHIAGEATAAGNQFATDCVMLTEGNELHPWALSELPLQAASTSSALTDAGFPMLEITEERSSVLRESTLQAYAEESVARGSGHIETFEIVARRDRTPRLGTYWPGDYALVRTAKTARLSSGRYRVRIVRIAFSKRGMVALECAPERVASGYPVPSSNRTWLRDKLRALAGSIAESNRGA